MPPLYGFILNSWFGRKNHRRDSQKNFTILKINTGVSESYQTYDALASILKKIYVKRCL